MAKNLFIALEGIDGSGKSTQMQLLKDNLEKAGHKVYLTCEPTDGVCGKAIRNIFTQKLDTDHRVIAGLFVADRLEHILDKTNGLLKKLEEGYTVITDRYLFSSYAYQGAHMSLDWVIAANSQSAELLTPDLNVYIDISPEVSMERITKNRTSTELFETHENLRKVRDTYLLAFKKLQDEETVFTVNGDQEVEAIAGEIWEKVKGLGS